MKVRVETDGTIEGTKIINLRTGEEVKNIEVTEYIDKNREWSIDSNMLALDTYMLNVAPTGMPAEFVVKKFIPINIEELQQQLNNQGSLLTCTCGRAYDPTFDHKGCL